MGAISFVHLGNENVIMKDLTQHCSVRGKFTPENYRKLLI